MKIEVQYSSYTRSFSLDSGPSYLTLIGSGNVFIHETGLLLEGDVPKLTLTWLFRLSLIKDILLMVYQKTICSRNTITVPYSQILMYKKTGGFRKRHMIVYRPINYYGGNIIVKFRILKSSKQQEKEFYKMLKDNLATVQSILKTI